MVGVVVVAGVSAQLLGLPGIPHVSLSSASPVRRYRPNKGRILEHLSIRIPRVLPPRLACVGCARRLQKFTLCYNKFDFSKCLWLDNSAWLCVTTLCLQWNFLLVNPVEKNMPYVRLNLSTFSCTFTFAWSAIRISTSHPATSGTSPTELVTHRLHDSTWAMDHWGKKWCDTIKKCQMVYIKKSGVWCMRSKLSAMIFIHLSLSSS